LTRSILLRGQKAWLKPFDFALSKIRFSFRQHFLLRASQNAAGFRISTEPKIRVCRKID